MSLMEQVTAYEVGSFLGSHPGWQRLDGIGPVAAAFVRRTAPHSVEMPAQRLGICDMIVTLDSEAAESFKWSYQRRGVEGVHDFLEGRSGEESSLEAAIFAVEKAAGVEGESSLAFTITFEPDQITELMGIMDVLDANTLEELQQRSFGVAALLAEIAGRGKKLAIIDPITQEIEEMINFEHVPQDETL